jgi:flagellar secretion chaperone FliS
MMNTKNSAFAYQQSNAISASAVGQVVALYDRILRDLREAMQAVEAGEIEKRVHSLTHALTIVGELQGVLDFERGGEPAKHLNGFYNVARGMMMQAGVTNSVTTMQELVSMFTRMRAAWAKAEQSVSPAEPTQRLRISSQPQMAIPPSKEVPADAPVSSGGWRA